MHIHKSYIGAHEQTYTHPHTHIHTHPHTYTYIYTFIHHIYLGAYEETGKSTDTNKYLTGIINDPRVIYAGRNSPKSARKSFYTVGLVPS